ncbi:adenosine kinase b [Chytriomyces sp. MP71]|nr:adenosine kinase b [Chytriomyces sp. MP71]
MGNVEDFGRWDDSADSRTYPLLFLGQPLLDISAHVDPLLLEKYALKPNDMILAEERHKSLFHELATNYSVFYTAGGSSQNTARGAQWLLPPYSTCFIGCVGDDDWATILRDSANASGVASMYVQEEAFSTGICAVLLTGAERSMVTDLQAASKLRLSSLQTPRTAHYMEQASIIYITGFLLKGSHEVVLHVAKNAHSRKQILAFNLSAPWISHVLKDEVATVIPYCDYIFGNASEALAYADANSLCVSSLHDIAQHIARIEGNPGRTVIVTNGENPVVVATADTVIEMSVAGLPNEEIVDSNGAGDGFCGGFCAGLLKGLPLQEAIKTGLSVAREVLKMPGATYPKVKPEDLRHFN